MMRGDPYFKMLTVLGAVCGAAAGLVIGAVVGGLAAAGLLWAAVRVRG